MLNAGSVGLWRSGGAVVLALALVPVALSLRLLRNELSFNCSQPDLPCQAEFNNCMYKEWMQAFQFTPTEPVEFSVHVDIRNDTNGDLEPVIVAEWKAKDDGGIASLKGTQLSVTNLYTSEHLCVHYNFLKAFDSMKNPKGEKWSFSVDKVVVDPGMLYQVSVSNLPKPNLEHTPYSVKATLLVPDCDDALMSQTRSCVEQGVAWKPTISLEEIDLRGLRQLIVAFDGGANVEKYKVFVTCDRDEDMKTLYNVSSLVNVTFALKKWTVTCCLYNVQIQPFFQPCKNDCRRINRTFNMCREKPHPPENNLVVWVIGVGLSLLCGTITFCAIYLKCRKQGEDPEKPREKPQLDPPVLHSSRSILIIYSRDHPLYTDIVLKLCAFLQAKCGTKVVLDLLDASWLSTIGRLQWIEQRKRQIEKSSDKILILCSPGVQAKWGAICGEAPVLLREDARSTVGDMLTLALQLITPDMQRPASYGKYLVAYFEEVSSERDVPSLFDIAVKYKLMKHFEELYFRILDFEKYQQGVEHCIVGIGKDEYFSCPSGEALRRAIETFQSYQLDNPDWFDRECVQSDEEVREDTSEFLENIHGQIYEKIPVCNSGLPIFTSEVDVCPQTCRICAVIPQIHEEPKEPTVIVSLLENGSAFSNCPSLEMPSVGVIQTDDESHPFLLAAPEPSGRSIEPRCFEMFPRESESRSFYVAHSEVTAPPPSMEDSFASSEPVEVEDNEMEMLRPSRGSDQGYSSRYSPVSDQEKVQDDLSSLAKLQMELFLNSPISSGFFTKSMEICDS